MIITVFSSRIADKVARTRGICVADAFTDVASSLDVAVQLSRMRDGSRRVTAITRISLDPAGGFALSDIHKFDVEAWTHREVRIPRG